MKIRPILASAALVLAACGDGDDNANMSVMDDPAMDNMAADNQAAAAPAGTMAANGQEYATMAAASDMYEIESARVALEKSDNAGVRELAQMIVTDHEKSTADLLGAAVEAEPAIAVTPRMNAEQQAMMMALQAAAAEDFDGTYLQQQVMAHQQALAMVRNYAQSGEAASLRQHASTVSGPIEQHLERARALMQSPGR